MNLRQTLGYGDLLVTCLWGLKSQVRPRRGVLRQKPLLTSLAALCAMVPARAGAGYR